MAKVNDEYLLANFGHMTQRDIAKHFDVSVSTINRHCKRLGLSEKTPISVRPKAVSSEAKSKEAPQSSDIDRLRELRDILYEQIRTAKGASVAQLSKEYREVLTDIRLLDGGGDDGETNIFDEIAISFSARTQGLPETDI